MAQGIGSIGGLVVLGVDIVDARGVEPSKCMIRLLPDTTFDRLVDNLTISYGGISRTFTDVAVAAVPTRIRTQRGEPWRWNAVGLDRRWKWRYPRISGTYNKRLCDGTVDPTTQKSARELATLLFAALGESGYNVSQVPANVYPPVVWDEAVAKLELQWLCDLLAMDVCPKIDNTFSVEPITSSVGPLPGGTPTSPSTHSFKAAVMPSSVRVQGSELRKQGWLDLTPVALDWDGDIKPLLNLNYMPSSGLGDLWPGAFPGIEERYRHLAFQTVHRWFAPEEGIILGEHLIETATDSTRSTKHCLDPQLRGGFFVLDDVGTNGVETLYSGKFRVRTDLNLVETEYPVYQLDAGLIKEAELQICTGYIELTDGQPTEHYQYDRTVSEARRATEPRVLRHPELLWHDIVDALYGAAGGRNTAVLDVEAYVYASETADSYSYNKAQDVEYDGIVPTSLIGAYTQVRYVAGNMGLCTTRIGANTEPDIRDMQRNQKRAQQRLSQMAEQMML